MKIWYDNQPDMSPYLDDEQDVNMNVLNEDWYFWIDKRQVWIPKGYSYNGASIPRACWWIVGSPFEPQLQAGALPHDFIYLTHILDKKTADETLYQLVRQSRVSSWRAHAIWGAVRTFGAIPWSNNKHDKADLYKLVQEVSKRPDAAKFCLA